MSEQVNQKERKRRKVKRGIVLSNKATKMVVVQVNRYLLHPIYKKEIVRSKKYYAHDEHGCSIGDEVEIEESRPRSRLKRWQVLKKSILKVREH